MVWNSLHQHSYYSLLDGISRPHQIAKRCKEVGMSAAALTDHGSVTCAAQIVKAFKKEGLKAILGNEFYIPESHKLEQEPANRKNFHLCVLAKNLKGWKGLVKATSLSNGEDNYYYKPRIRLEELAECGAGEFICFSGHPGSELANLIFNDPGRAYGARTYEEARKLHNPDYYSLLKKATIRYRDLFGAANFYLEIQLIDKENLPAAEVIAKALRHFGKKEGIPCVATADSHYINKADSADQRVALCAKFQKTLAEVNQAIADDDEGVMGFFQSDNYHIPTQEEMGSLHDQEEIENSFKISEACEAYSILNNPQIPRFDTEGNGTPDEYLRKLCQDGWRTKLAKLPKDKQGEYQGRIRHELDVLLGAGLASYFLMVRDFLMAAKGRGELTCVRGSAAGCMVSYLIDISDVDPVKYSLLFERFYNAGRNTKDHIQLPDIDCDLETANRHKTIDYIKQKYGKDKVGQIATFGRLQGRAAIKDVLRVRGVGDFELANRITEFIPDESKISDELQLMREAGEEPSIIRWALENEAKGLSEFCTLKDDGSLEGPLWPYFAQAMRLEGIKRNAGKHAAGLIVSNEPLANCCPMIRDKKTGDQYCGMEFPDLESMGMVKIDILGTTVLDKLSGFRRLLAGKEL